MQIDISAAFDRVNHQGILFMLCSVGIEGCVLSMRTQFLLNLLQHFMMDGHRRKLVDVLAAAPQGVFSAHYCSSCKLWSFFPFMKIS